MSKTTGKAERVREIFEYAARELDAEGFLLHCVHFNRDNDTGKLVSVRMTYEQRTKEMQ